MYQYSNISYELCATSFLACARLLCRCFRLAFAPMTSSILFSTRSELFAHPDNARPLFQRFMNSLGENTGGPGVSAGCAIPGNCSRTNGDVSGLALRR